MGRSFPSTCIAAGLVMLRVMISVLVWLILSPTWLAKLRRLVFSCKWWWVCDSKARSSAKSRSSNVPSYSSWGIFCCFSHYPVDDHIEKKSRHHISLPNSCFYFKPDFAMSYTASEIVVETFYNLDDFFWNSICS